MGLQLCTPVGSVLRHVQTTDCLLPGLPSVDTEWSPPAMDAVPILLSLLSIPLVRGVRRLSLTTDTDTSVLEDTPHMESVSSIPVVTPSNMSPDCTRGRLRLDLRPILTTDTDTDLDTDTVSDTEIVWDTDTVWDTPMADTMAMDTVMDMDTATM